MSDRKSKLQKYSAPALEKGLDILEYLSLTDSRPTLSQLAAGIGRSKSEIFRMMIVLEERGYISRSEGDIYSLTDRISTLGAERSINSRLSEAAKPYLEELAGKTGLSNHLSVLDGSDLLVIANANAPHYYGLSVQVGYRTALGGSAAGACFLADLPTSQQRRDVLERLAQQPTPDMLAQLDNMVSQCRGGGYASASNAETNAILELSAPVVAIARKETIAAITIACFASDSMTNRLPGMADALRAAASAFSNKLAITMPTTGGNGLLQLGAL
ncbi:helix-turn-helix domain-containing protein [Hoeflea sp. CAU 1731]